MQFFTLIVLYLFYIRTCVGLPPQVPSVLHVVSSEGSCQCLISTSDLSQLIAYMDQNVISTLKQLNDLKDMTKRMHDDVISTNTKLTDVKHATDRLDKKQKVLLEEVKGLKTRMIMGRTENTTPNEYYPIASRLVRTHENALPAMETIENAKENLTNLFDELITVKNMTLEALQENNDIKEELENEKRKRRSLQTRVNIVEEELNQTQSRVQIINEKVIENDFKNLSNIGEMLDQLVIVRLHEMDELNRTAWENKLEKLEYKIEDVHRNGTFLTRRLDNFENITALATDLWRNGTILRKIDGMETTLKIIENYEDTVDEIRNLGSRISVLNASFNEGMVQMSSYFTNLTQSQKAEMLDLFQEEFSRFNDSWGITFNKLNAMVSEVTEGIESTKRKTEKVINDTIDQTSFTNMTYYESLGKLSELRSKIQKLEGEMSPFASELESFGNRFRNKSKEMEMQLLSQIQAVNKTLEASFLNASSLHDLRSVEIRQKYKEIEVGLRDIVSNISNLESRETEQTKEILAQMVNIRAEFESTLDDLSNRLTQLLASKHNASILALNEEISLVREGHQKLERKLATSVNILEGMLTKGMDNFKENLDLLRGEQQQMMLLFKHMEVVNDYVLTATDTPSIRSRSGDGNTVTKDKIKEEDLPCAIPDSQDPELIIGHLDHAAGVTVPHGFWLTFSCMKIGRYVLNGDSTMRCMNGRWNGSFPACMKLVDESTIRGAGRINIDPCVQKTGQFPDPDDCTRFYNCWEGTKYLNSCPKNLYFDERNRSCNYPSQVECKTRNRTAELGNLLNIVPPITFDPIEINGAYTLVTSNALGELVVYPGVNLNLHCLYPRALGELKWQTPDQTSSFPPAWETRGIASLEEAYKLTIHLRSVSQKHSGDYTCITPTLKQHTVKIVVKGIQCQPLQEASSLLKIFYRPHPDIPGYTVTSLALFTCPDGYILDGPANATCLVLGNWSQPVPQCLKDELREAKRGKGCNKVEFFQKQGLQQIEPELSFYNIGDKLHFKCGKGLTLVGNAFVRCKDNGEWTSFPECLNPWS